MLKKIFAMSLLLMPFLVLQGCAIGSKIRVKDSDVNAEFPSLHSVPERPNLDEIVLFNRGQESSIQALSKTPQEDGFPKKEEGAFEDENEKLRRQFGL